VFSDTLCTHTSASSSLRLSSLESHRCASASSPPPRCRQAEAAGHRLPRFKSYAQHQAQVLHEGGGRGEGGEEGEEEGGRDFTTTDSQHTVSEEKGQRPTPRGCTDCQKTQQALSFLNRKSKLNPNP
jgi:hypothetical protein